jgi:hypothetical protein
LRIAGFTRLGFGLAALVRTFLSTNFSNRCHASGWSSISVSADGFLEGGFAMKGPSGDKFQDLCTMFGLMTLTWAWAENILAITVGIINKASGPIKGYPEPPVSLKKRVAYFRVVLRDLDILKPLKEDGRALAMRFIELGARRNKLVHGAAWQIHEGEFQSFGIRVKGGDNVVEDHRFNHADAISLNIEIAELQDNAAAFLLKVAALFS